MIEGKAKRSLIYLPKNVEHPNLRVRKNCNKYEITKKTPIDGDVSRQMEETIHLTKDEFDSLSALDAKRLRKIRYYIEHEGRTGELDIFQGDLEGLVLVDFEFESEEEKLFSGQEVQVNSIGSDFLKVRVPSTDPALCTKYMSMLLKWLDTNYMKEMHSEIRQVEDNIKI